MRKRMIVPAVGITILALVVSACSSNNSKAPKDQAARYSALTAEGKDKATSDLLAAAKKEGSVNWYTVTNADDSNALAAAFEKAYPGIKVNVTRSNEPGIANQYQTESRAKHYSADVIDDDVVYMNQFHTAGLLAANIPSFGFQVPKDSFGPWWVVTSAEPATIAWNTNLVSAADAPKTYSDLLKPEFKGKIALDISPLTTVQTLAATMGVAATTTFFTQLVNTQDAAILQSHDQIDQLMAAGKYAICVECFGYAVAALRDTKHAPVDFGLQNPVPTAVSPVSIAAHSPHPNAALLLLNFLASQQGAEVYAKLGLITQTAGVKMASPGLQQLADSPNLYQTTPPNVVNVATQAQTIVSTVIASKVAGK